MRAFIIRAFRVRRTPPGGPEIYPPVLGIVGEKKSQEIEEFCMQGSKCRVIPFFIHNIHRKTTNIL